MTSDKSIFIQNIYYMLTYAFQVLKHDHYAEIATEHFENIYDMFAAIFGKGVSRQLKQGLYKEYVLYEDNLSTLRGHLDFQKTMQNKLTKKQELYCHFDELSVNNLYNRILKTTMWLLFRNADVKPERKALLKKNLLYFDEVEGIEKAEIKWSTIRFQKCNQNYRMLLNVCNLVLEGLILSTEKGEVKWADFLPVMQTDITLKNTERTLVIDAKYYSHTMQAQYDTYTIHSGNLYQIFTYVKNLDKDHCGKVAGLLLYAKTTDKIQPDHIYRMGGNAIGVKTLDLNCDFTEIRAQLDDIVRKGFGLG